jgi:hypothetical protein
LRHRHLLRNTEPRSKPESCHHLRSQLRCTRHLAPAFSNCAHKALALSRASVPIRTRYQDIPPFNLVSTNTGSRPARTAACFCLSSLQAKVASAREGLPKRGARATALACAVGGGTVPSWSSSGVWRRLKSASCLHSGGRCFHESAVIEATQGVR